MAIVTIVGAGMMGTAMCWPISDQGHMVRLVGAPLDDEIIRTIQETGNHPKLARAIPDGVDTYFSNDLPTAITNSEIIIGGISSFGVDWFAKTVGPLLNPSMTVLSVTKGLIDRENGDLDILPREIDRLLPVHLQGSISLNAIAGPCIAHELAARRQTAVVFTGSDAHTLDKLKTCFSTAYYHIWTSTDVIGVEVCAALKNAYALAVGLAVGIMEAAGSDGLAHNYNPQAALFGQSCYEMRRLVHLLGGDEENVAWLPGPGDLYVTVFGGRTVQLGKMLGKGVSFIEARERMAGVTLESVEIVTRVARALPLLEARNLIDRKDLPLIWHLHEIINQGEPVNIPWDKFFYQHRS